MKSKAAATKISMKFIKKTLTVILAGAFLCTNTFCWAKEEEPFSAGTENAALSSGPADNNKLAPSSRLNSEEFKISLTVAAICKHIENDGNLDDKSYLNDVLARLDAGKNPNITVLPYEIMIEIPSENLAVRYFDPTKANVITPYSDVSKLMTKTIGPRLNRQIIHRIKALSVVSTESEKETQKDLSTQVDRWKTVRKMSRKSPDRGFSTWLKSSFRMFAYRARKLKARLQGKIGTFGATRGLTQYNNFVRDLPRMPALNGGLIGCMRSYVEKNNAIGQTTNYLDACGGMGCTATEFSCMFGTQGGRSFVADINEWTIDDLLQHTIDSARKEGKRWGVEDNLSRQFTFFKSDITTLNMPEKMDIITVFAGLHFVDDPLKAITNLYNNLKNGGILMTHYPCHIAHRDALDIFYEVLAGLSKLGATVECITVQDDRDPNYICLQIVIVKNDPRNIRLNLTPERRTGYEVVPEKRSLSTKAVYYKNDSGKEAVEFGEAVFDGSRFTAIDRKHMADIVEIAREKIKNGELDPRLPVVARIVDKDGNIVTTSIRTKHETPTAHGVNAVHGEIQAIRDAEAKGFSDWTNATIYITMDSCYNCSRALTEFYGFKRVVYGIKDATIEEIDRNVEDYRRNNVALVECDDGVIRSNLSNLLQRAFTKVWNRPDSNDPMLAKELAISQQFRQDYQRIFKEDIQVIVFDADLWVSKGQEPWEDQGIHATKERLMFRHLEWLKQDLNPKKKHVILIVGKTENAKQARRKIISESIFKDENILIYNPSIFPKAVTSKPVIDMHIHSTSSDGELSPREIIRKAAASGLKAISITDHDDMSAYLDDPNLFDFASQNGIELIAGVEASSLCWYKNVVGQSPFADGYWFTDLVAFFPKLQNETEKACRDRLQMLNGIFKQYKTAFKRCVLSTFARFKKDYPQAQLNYRELLGKAIDIDRSSGFSIDNRDDLWQKIGCTTEESFEEKIIAGDNDFLSSLPRCLSEFAVTLRYIVDKSAENNVRLPSEEKDYGVTQPTTKLNIYILNNKDRYFGKPGDDWMIPTMEEVIKLIKENRGFAMLAHPHAQRITMGSDAFENMIQIARGWGLDGIEAFSRGNTGIDSLYYNGIAQAGNLLVTNGSDFHGPRVTPDRQLAIGKNTGGNQTSFEMIEKLEIAKIISQHVRIEKDRMSSAGIIKEINSKLHEYITKAKIIFKDMLGEDRPDTLVRVPIEAIESVGIDNVMDFLETFQAAPNGYVELYYMSGTGEVNEAVYQKYGLQKKHLPKDFKRTRENTVTLFPAFKGEDINQTTIVSRLGDINTTPENTILSPIGLQHDPAGLIRATILGLKIMDIARQVKEGKAIDKDAVHVEILNQLRDMLDSSDFKSFDLTPDDIVALATGNINSILIALKKLIKLLPIVPIDAEELRQIYEHAKQTLIAA